jgi:hypothetical protein
MSWYRSKWWRFALSDSGERFVEDGDGLWRRVGGALYVLIEREGLL